MFIMLQNTGMETSDSDIPSNINNAERERTTPFEIHKLSEEDFGKVYHRGECEFSNAPTFCVIFRLGLSRGVFFYLEVPNELTYLLFTLPLC